MGNSPSPLLKSQLFTIFFFFWDSLLLDFPILATCSQVVIKELKPLSQPANVVLKDNSQRMLCNKNRVRWQSRPTVYMLVRKEEGKKIISHVPVFKQRSALSKVLWIMLQKMFCFLLKSIELCYLFNTTSFYNLSYFTSFLKNVSFLYMLDEYY